MITIIKNSNMKISVIQTIIAIAISALIGFALCHFHPYANKFALLIGCFVGLSVTLITAMGISFQESRTSANVKVLAWVFSFATLIINVIFTFFNFSAPVYFIVIAICALIFISIAVAIAKAKQ